MMAEKLYVVTVDDTIIEDFETFEDAERCCDEYREKSDYEIAVMEYIYDAHIGYDYSDRWWRYDRESRQLVEV